MVTTCTAIPIPHYLWFECVYRSFTTLMSFTYNINPIMYQNGQAGERPYMTPYIYVPGAFAGAAQGNGVGGDIYNYCVLSFAPPNPPIPGSVTNLELNIDT